MTSRISYKRIFFPITLLYFWFGYRKEKRKKNRLLISVLSVPDTLAQDFRMQPLLLKPSVCLTQSPGCHADGYTQRERMRGDGAQSGIAGLCHPPRHSVSVCAGVETSTPLANAFPCSKVDQERLIFVTQARWYLVTSFQGVLPKCQR